MSFKRLLLPTVALLAVLAPRAHGHFLFVRILPPAEGGRAAEVYFSELAEAGDSRFVDKIAHTQLWLQTLPGRFEPLKVHKGSDRLRAWLPYNRTVMVGGTCTYGVLARTGATPFLLRHHPKAIAGSPDEINALTPHGQMPLEIAVTVSDAGLRLRALRHGKPVPHAPFVTIDSRLNNVKLTADADGWATWRPPAPGEYSVYTRHTAKEAGEFDGKKYAEIRDFATLAFSWPLERKGADPEAVARFEEAVAARASWKQFPGFKAHIAGNLDGRPFTGTVTIDRNGEVQFTDDDPSRAEAVSSWVQDQLESIVLHRLDRQPASPAAKPVLRFAETTEDHKLGRLLLFEGGKFASSYRVKDRQILVVNRHRGKENMTITVLDNDRNAEGRFLPRSYTVQYWEATTGRLTRTETVQERWHRVQEWDLPAHRLMTTATVAGLSVRSFTLTKHELLSNR